MQFFELCIFTDIFLGSLNWKENKNVGNISFELPEPEHFWTPTQFNVQIFYFT